MNNHKPLSYQLSTDSYGQVRAVPLLLANELNSKLEQWFQNCKYGYLAISKLLEDDYNKPLQLEFIYSLRNIKERSFEEIKSDVITEFDLLNYHKLVKIIHEYIELSYKVYLSLTEHKQGLNIIDFETYIETLSKRFHKKNFPDKLELIIKSLNLQESLKILEQINRVRNCLEHRAGVVSEIDCDQGKKYMSIKWRYPKIVSPGGEMSPLSSIKGNQNADIIFTDEMKKFRINEKILFDFYDNTKCIFSINVCFKSIIDGIYSAINVNQEKPIIIREFKSV